MTWLLSRKIEVRFVLLLLTASLIGTVLFGWAVKVAMEHPEPKGWAAAVRETASFPEKVGEVLSLPFSPSRWLVESSPPTGQEAPPASADFRDPGYLLLSRHDGDRKVGLVELVRLHPWEVLHTWLPDVDALTEITENPYKNKKHPWISYALQEGSLLIKAFGVPNLIKIDSCSAIRWATRGPGVHHSIERDADGHFWTPYTITKSTVPGDGMIVEAGLAQISASGEVLSTVSLSGALIRAGYRHLLYTMSEKEFDLIHMNDIQPVLEDGAHWRRGDLFVSLRTPSLVLLYRPSSDEVIWAQAGPWLHQHDVNIVSPHEISVFSNNSYTLRGGGHFHGGHWFSEVMLHDFRTGETHSPWRDALARHKVYTGLAGRGTVLDNGDVFVEETMRGRTLRVAADGTLRWSYVNRVHDGPAYHLGWSRYLDAEEGAAIERAVVAANCAPAE